jgi:uncharacterized protein with ACT and thioredoxin-like domain
LTVKVSPDTVPGPEINLKVTGNEEVEVAVNSIGQLPTVEVGGRAGNVMDCGCWLTT